MQSDGFVCLPVDETVDATVWSALSKMLKADPNQLGRGRDAGVSGPYNSLQLARAWRIDHAANYTKYQAGLNTVISQMKTMEQQPGIVLQHPPLGLPTKTEAGANQLPRPLATEANEQLLLHGTPTKFLFSLLSTGLNERFSGLNAGTAYGDGIYLAEDITKSDQYVEVDREYDDAGENADLHARLYPEIDGGSTHPGNIYYVCVCRVAIGQCKQTKCGNCPPEPPFNLTVVHSSELHIYIYILAGYTYITCTSIYIHTNMFAKLNSNGDDAALCPFVTLTRLPNQDNGARPISNVDGRSVSQSLSNRV